MWWVILLWYYKPITKKLQGAVIITTYNGMFYHGEDAEKGAGW